MTDAAHELAIELRDVNVHYRVYEERTLGARQLLARGFQRRTATDVHAVKDLSLTVTRGEVVGIVGSNGSGKSTLLRAIAGLQSIQSGTIRTRGEAHLLAVNAALNRELSGYRNVMLGGLALGLTREQIEAKISDVEEFSELGVALKRPMRTYSSGMRARLAFSIATLRIPEILLLDEALAVGDRRFRAKSLERVRAIQAEAGTVLMVTHNLREIRKTCNRAVWLEHGELISDGAVDDVLSAYSGDDSD